MDAPYVLTRTYSCDGCPSEWTDDWKISPGMEIPHPELPGWLLVHGGGFATTLLCPVCRVPVDEAVEAATGSTP